MAKTSKLFSLDDLDLTKKCAEGFEFEVTDDATGTGTGLYLTVVGGHAQKVIDWTRKTINARRVFDEMQEKRGKKAQTRTVEEDMQFAVELAAIRVVAWRGLSDECTHENVMRLCEINPPIREQILKASEDLANFTKKSDKN